MKTKHLWIVIRVASIKLETSQGMFVIKLLKNKVQTFIHWMLVMDDIWDGTDVFCIEVHHCDWLSCFRAMRAVMWLAQSIFVKPPQPLLHIPSQPAISHSGLLHIHEPKQQSGVKWGPMCPSEAVTLSKRVTHKNTRHIHHFISFSFFSPHIFLVHHLISKEMGKWAGNCASRGGREPGFMMNILFSPPLRARR